MTDAVVLMGTPLSQIGVLRRGDALGYVMTSESQCLNLMKVSDSVSSGRNQGLMGELERVCWAALKVDS